MKSEFMKFTGGLNEEKFVDAIIKDFETRREERKPYELQWQLNMNFVMGNQYCGITGRGTVEDSEKLFFWQEREVFNHLAPILETRLAKLGRIRPKMNVLPASSEDSDIASAKVSSAILENASANVGLEKIIASATMWSETCGTVFYKAVWDGQKGALVKNSDGKELREGDIDISVVPPFEIFPDSNASEDISACSSIIHARAFPVSEIKDIWGVEVEGADINVFSFDRAEFSGGGLGYGADASALKNGIKHGHAVVLEYYELPSKEYQNGRLAVIAGRKLLFLGELPFNIGENGIPAFPFVRQTSVAVAGCFWGASIIERAIPVQRAYNAVKNRKHEFLNRIAMGVLTVEDGSVDTDNLADEGLSPGKILVYRQGSNPPVFMDTGRVPSEFSYEEDRLLSEFVSVSGISELMRSSSVNKNMTSGIALQILIEQDDTRLSVTGELIKSAVKDLAKLVLRLYRQFAARRRTAKIAGENGSVELMFWRASDITSEDVIFTTENEISSSPAQRQNFVFELLNAGLLQDENGKLSNRMRAKVLDMLGFGMWESSKDIDALHIRRAMEENLLSEKEGIKVNSFDDHEIHIAEHTKQLLGGGIVKDNSIRCERLKLHIDEHKRTLTAVGLSNEDAKSESQNDERLNELVLQDENVVPED